MPYYKGHSVLFNDVDMYFRYNQGQVVKLKDILNQMEWTETTNFRRHFNWFPIFIISSWNTPIYVKTCATGNPKVLIYKNATHGVLSRYIILTKYDWAKMMQVTNTFQGRLRITHLVCSIYLIAHKQETVIFVHDYSYIYKSIRSFVCLL